MPFYRMGARGEDTWAHLNFGRKGGPDQCAMPAFPEDNQQIGPKCGRMSVALCDAPGCDKPMCELHRTKHATKANTDFCPEHKAMAGPVDRLCVKCGAVLLTACECPHCGTAIQDQPA